MLLEGAVLARGLRAKLVGRFPLFYAYLFFVLLQDLARLFAQYRYSQIYTNLYWTTQFVCLVLGSVVVFEIYRLGLREFPGTATMARNLLGIAFLGIFVKAMLTIPHDSPEWIAGAYVKLERDLRGVQSIAILILLVLLVWYAIPLGRNLRGILVGYGTFVALSVVQLSLVSHFWYRAERIWRIAQPAGYMAVLGVWVVALWKADEEKHMVTPTRPGGDYDQLAASTQDLLKKAGTRLGTAVRP